MKLEKLKACCNRIIPLVYDESLSYYELLCKIMDKVNILIEFYNVYSDEWEEKIKEAVVETLQEWLDDGTIDEIAERILADIDAVNDHIDEVENRLLDNFKDIVYINNWGAKGDGVTDDTAAIQRAINNNPQAIFVFHGKYKITDTITVRFGSQTFLLSDIQYEGPTGRPAFFISNAYYPGYSDVARYGAPVFIGGCVSGKANDDTTMDCAFQCTSYTTRISEVHIRNYNRYGILLSDNFNNPGELLGANRPGAAQIDNCIITNFPEVRGTGICVRYTDIRISNCNMNGCMSGIDYLGGNLFVENTHISPTNGTTQTPGSTCIFVNPSSPAGVMGLNLVGMYFNGIPESIIKLPDNITCNHTIQMDGCQGIFANPDNSDHIYIIKAKGTSVHYVINSLTIRIGNSTHVYCYPMFKSGFTDYNCVLNLNDMGLSNPETALDVRYQSIINKPHIVSSATYPLEPRKMVRVAGLYSQSQTGVWQKFRLTFGINQIAEFSVMYNATDVRVAGIKYGTWPDTIKLFVGAIQEHTIDGNTYYARYLYLGNNTETDTPYTSRFELTCMESDVDMNHRVAIYRAASNTRESFTYNIINSLPEVLSQLTQG